MNIPVPHVGRTRGPCLSLLSVQALSGEPLCPTQALGSPLAALNVNRWLVRRTQSERHAWHSVEGLVRDGRPSPRLAVGASPIVSPCSATEARAAQAVVPAWSQSAWKGLLPPSVPPLVPLSECASLKTTTQHRQGTSPASAPLPLLCSAPSLLSLFHALRHCVVTGGRGMGPVCPREAVA